ncbi:MAG: hypothetical protein A2W99_02035 [Bacteroidetes bacterium GWF2_33_16]|nr:MAG: hypothetical protein A2X00_16120 [Bacteroidetes bacterium GWE2_32_14]OFY07049.1 MAG: hypothetical protein A2W99_02035 [Bacteroidetes bacterium GWF2_33_16]
MKNLILIVSFLFLFLNKIDSQDFAYKEKKELKGYPEYILDVKFSPFRNYFALTIGNNTLEIYNKDWKKVFDHQGNPKSVGGYIAFSPDEKYLAYAKYKSDNDIAIIRLEDKKVIQILNGHAQNINKVEFSHNGKYLASSSHDKSVCIWKWNNDQMELNQKFVFSDGAMGVSFSYNDEYIIAGGYDKKIVVFQLINSIYQPIDTVLNLKYWIYDVSFHPWKNEFVASSQYDIKRYKLNKSKFNLTDSLIIRVNNKLSYNSTGDYLVFGTNNDVSIVKMTNVEMIEYEHIYRHSEHVFGGSFSDDGIFLTTFSSDKSCIIWELSGIEPSRKSIIIDYMEGELTTAQKIILTSDVIENILNKLDKRLTAPRDEFETSTQYTDRRDKLKSEVLAQLQSFTEKYYKVKLKAGNKITIPLERIIGYNADINVYKIRFMETDAGVNIPVIDAKQFKDNWKDAYIEADKNISKDGISFEYSNFQLVHPLNKKLYTVNPVENPFHITKKTRNAQVEKGRADEIKINLEQKTDSEKTVIVTKALLFATSIYDSFSELVNPVIDASTIAEELKDNYFVDAEIIINPTLSQTIEKIREYAKLKYSATDNLLILFAGHGIYDDVFKEGYVISRDSKSDDVAKTSYLSHSNLRTMINNIPCNHILLVMDVCFGGTFDPIIASKSRAADLYAEVTNEEFIQRKQKYKTRLYLTSGGKEYVPDGRPGHHSPFARKFLEALRNYGGPDGLLTINEIIQFIEKVEPQPRFGEFGDNEPGSDFLLIAK